MAFRPQAPASKLAAIKALGAEVVLVPRVEWFEFVVRQPCLDCSVYRAYTAVYRGVHCSVVE